MNDIKDSKAKTVMRGNKIDMCAALEAMRRGSREVGLVESEQIGINARVAADMIQS